MKDDEQSKQDRVAEPASLFPVSASLSIDELMRRVRAEVERRRLLSREEDAGRSVENDGQQRLPRWNGFGSRLPVKDSYRLAEFLQLWDEEFVSTVYRVVLRRPADQQGYKHHLDALRSGQRSRVQVLGSIRFSEEGQRLGVHIDGLLIPYRLQNLRRIPLIGRLASFGLTLVRLPNQLQSLATHSGRTSQAMVGLVGRIEETLEQHFKVIHEDLDERANATMQRVIEARQATLARDLSEIREDIRALRAELAHVKAKYEAHQGSWRDVSPNSLVSAVNESRRGLIDLQRKLMTLASSNPVSGSAGVQGTSEAATSILDAEYTSFEDTFRGTRDDIKKRAEHYLDHLAAAGVTPSSGLVIDLGCGRGEWLELLRERGYQARGVDMNPVMLDDSIAHGLDVVEADALTYLRGLSDASVAAITSMHLVEHLPQAVLIQLLDEAMRVLKDGGLLALETPNPENITVGACWFYMDPTHRNPIPPPLLQWTVTNRGYVDATIHRLKEHRGVSQLETVPADQPNASQMNEMIGWFTAAPDYAIVARKA
ncbi:methyltransferase domain-containing protein [Dyella silvae]|uniref:methyltransferase domain-containing protein n=1 Tax=Dyella silvae TaxID=2994424 RepID=UPI002264DC2A|nr:methyltransferase domain-containing protein [Dyella silvae]